MTSDKDDLKLNNNDIDLYKENNDTYVVDISNENDSLDKKKKSKKEIIIRGLRILFTIGFFVFTALFINEVFIQPYKLKRSIEKAKDLYNYDLATDIYESEDTLHENLYIDDKANEEDIVISDDISPTPIPDPNKDEMGRLKKFSKLLEVNEDVKGWLRIDNIDGLNDTKIDYVVMQSDLDDPEYYLSRDWASKEYLKAGSLFLDTSSSVESNTRNLIIHGHNMTSSDDMFHYLVNYKELEFLKKHPIISFDTIYDEGLWKVFAVYITPGNNDRDDFFPFVKSSFKNNRDYLEYLYQIRVRSFYNIDDVDINEDDQILTLATCSYELSNYRTIVVARKIRDGEDPFVDTDSIHKNKKALNPPSFYKHYGGKAPIIPSLEDALKDGLLPWYNPVN